MVDRKKLGIAPSAAVIGEHFQQAAMHMQQHLADAKKPRTDDDSEAFEPRTIKANRGPTFQFDGRMLGEHSTNANGRKSKWTEVRVWETPSGKWVIESVGCSDEPGQVDIVDAAVIESAQDGRSMEFQAMDFWGWSSPAKALAKKLGWDLVVRID